MGWTSTRSAELFRSTFADNAAVDPASVVKVEVPFVDTPAAVFDV